MDAGQLLPDTAGCCASLPGPGWLLLDVCPSLMSDARSSEALKPFKSPLNYPTPSPKHFAGLHAVVRNSCRDALPAQPRPMCP
jgi:hypothetical protein